MDVKEAKLSTKGLLKCQTSKNILLFTILNPEIDRSTNQMFDETAFTKDVIRLILPLGISTYSGYL